MFDKSNYGKIFNFLINIPLGIVLPSVGLILSHRMGPLLFFQSFVVSMGVGYLICDLVPAPAWGQKLVRRLHIRNPLGAHLLSTLVGTLVLVTGISFFCQFTAVGSLLFLVWPHALPYLLGAGYLVLVVFLPVCAKLSDSLTSR